jgi:glucose-1-phosphate thymidylyltransferase
MKGIILAGGSGTRLHPLTKVTSKQLLPIYNKPLIYYPLETLLSAGIRDILFIISPENAGDFLKLLGSGKEWGAKFSYEIQDKPEGIAQSFLIAKNFIGKDSCTLILGDNIFEDDFSLALKDFSSGARVFGKEVKDPHRFGVIEYDERYTVLSLEEKPKNPKSSCAQVGLYVCDNSVISKAEKVERSVRGEFEIVDIMNQYLQEKSLSLEIIKGAWFDAGTHESMFEAISYMRKKFLFDSSHLTQ